MTSDPNASNPAGGRSRPFFVGDSSQPATPFTHNGNVSETNATPQPGAAPDLRSADAMDQDRLIEPERPEPPFPTQTSDWGSQTKRQGSGSLALQTGILGLAIALCLGGIAFNLQLLGLVAGLAALLISAAVIWQDLRPVLLDLVSPRQWVLTLAIATLLLAALTLIRFTGTSDEIANWLSGLNWEAVGASGEVVGALGQILIAILAVYVAWRQYVISKDLTIQQNLITQQQTIDSYFQGISELVLDEEGLLEDWPQERAIAEGRTAAILSSVDGNGKAKVVRFLSRSRLLSPLKRDRLLGRAILDGAGSYEEDRLYGTRVIDLGVMLAGANLSQTDLRWTDLSDINLIRANLHRADLVRANLSRTILCDADLSQTDLMGARFFYGPVETATPRSRTDLPDYKTGLHTGAVVENADFTNAQRMSEEQRYYCCAWGGSKTRRTVPGGCGNIPNQLGR